MEVYLREARKKERSVSPVLLVGFLLEPRFGGWGRGPDTPGTRDAFCKGGPACERMGPGLAESLIPTVCAGKDF